MRRKVRRKPLILVLLFVAALLAAALFFVIKEANFLLQRSEVPGLTFMEYPNTFGSEESETNSVLLVLALVAGKGNDEKAIREVNGNLSATALSGMCDGEDPNFYYDWKATTTLLTPYVWSLDIDSSEFCGGAHPNEGWSGLTYLLKPYGSVTWTHSGKHKLVTIDLKDMFTDYEKNKKAIFSIVMEKYGEHIPECRGNEEVEFILEDAEAADAVDPFLFSVSKDGMKIRSFMLPRPVLYCEPYDLFISYDEFQPYMNKDFLTMVRPE